MRRCLALLAALALLGAPSLALAEGRVPTCVEVETGRPDAAAFKRLVESELDRHLSHRAVKEDCRSHLRVELIELGSKATSQRYVTGRINAQVPHRVRVGSRGIEPALVELLTVVLHNDPMTLRGPESGGWFGRQTRSLLRGKNYFGVEPFELFAPVDWQPQMLPGFALTARREGSAWFLGLRLASAFALDAPRDEAVLSLWVSAQGEAAVFLAPEANTSAFLSVLLGAEYQRFKGPAPYLGAGAAGTAVELGFSLGARGGIELLRVSSSRLVAFAQISTPAFISEDEDGGVMDQWLPTGLLGGGIVF